MADEPKVGQVWEGDGAFVPRRHVRMILRHGRRWAVAYNAGSGSGWFVDMDRDWRRWVKVGKAHLVRDAVEGANG